MPGTARDASRRHTLVGVALVLIASVGFSARGVLIKLSYPYGVDPETLLALRMIFSLPFFLAIGLMARAGPGAPLARGDMKMVIALGFLGYYLSSYLSFLGLVYIPAALERLLLYLTPTMVVLLSALVFGHRVRRHHVIALAVTYAGILLVFADNLWTASEPGATMVGAALVLTSAITYAVYLIASGDLIPRIGAARFTSYALSIACVLVIAQFLVTRDLAALVLPAPVYAYAVTMAIFSTVLPTLWMAEGIRRLGANQSAMVSAIGPVSTIVLAAITLGEPITPIQMAGAALVLAGVWLVSVKREAASTLAPAPRER